MGVELDVAPWEYLLLPEPLADRARKLSKGALAPVGGLKDFSPYQLKVVA